MLEFMQVDHEKSSPCERTMTRGSFANVKSILDLNNK